MISKSFNLLKKSYKIFLILFFVTSNCSKESIIEPPQTFSPILSNLISPTFLFNASTSKHIVSAQVADPQGLEDIAVIRYSIIKVDAFSPTGGGDLNDDGENGDIIPNDGVYTTQIQGTFAQNDSGEYSLEIIAEDKSQNASNVLQAPLFILSGDENLAPVIIDVGAPTAVPIDSPSVFLVTAQVVDAEGLQDVETVSYQFFPPAQPNPTETGFLFDDGSSGDEEAGDGIFTANLLSNLIEDTNDYFIRLQAEDESGNKSQPVLITIRGRLRFFNSPEIIDIRAPDIVNTTETSEVVISAEVTDSQGISDIDSVQLRLFLPDGQEAESSPQQLLDDGDISTSGDSTAGDGIFSAVLVLPDVDEAPSDLKLTIVATDKSGTSSGIVEHFLTITFDNAPVISNLVAPERVTINPTQDTPIFITINVKDPNGLADIDTVQFRSFLPGGQEANNSPLQLFDDGDPEVSRDVEAGDGIYSILIFLPSQGVTPGDFRFVFSAKDNAGLESNIIEHIMRVEQ